MTNEKYHSSHRHEHGHRHGHGHGHRHGHSHRHGHGHGHHQEPAQAPTPAPAPDPAPAPAPVPTPAPAPAQEAASEPSQDPVEFPFSCQCGKCDHVLDSLPGKDEQSGFPWLVTWSPCRENEAAGYIAKYLVPLPDNEQAPAQNPFGSPDSSSEAYAAAPQWTGQQQYGQQTGYGSGAQSGPFGPQAPDQGTQPGMPPSTGMPFTGDPGSSEASYGGWGSDQQPVVAKGKTVDAIEENLYHAGKTTGVATAPVYKVQNWAHVDDRYEKY